MEHSIPTTRIEASIEVACSPKEVWAYLGNFEAVEAWAPALTRSVRTTGPDLDVGSRRTVEYRRLFRMEQEVTEWFEGKGLQYAVYRAPWPLRHFYERWEVSPSVIGTHVRASVAYDLWFGPVGRLANWLFTRHVLRYEMHSGLKGLKRAAEAG